MASWMILYDKYLFEIIQAHQIKFYIEWSYNTSEVVSNM